MKRKYILSVVVGLGLAFQTGAAWAQTGSPVAQPMDGYPDYPVPYVVPTTAEVKEVVDRIQKRAVQNSVFQVFDSSTGLPVTDFSKPNKNAVIPDSVGSFVEWSYPNGVSLSACHTLTEETGDTSYVNYAVRFFDFTFKAMPYFRGMKENKVIKNNPYEKMVNMKALDHCGAISCALIKTQKVHPDPRFRAWVDTVANYISNKQFRLDDGTIARERPQPESLWADDFYMCIPFIAQMGSLTGDNKYYDDAVRQVIQLSARLFDEKSGLYDHGWNENSSEYDPEFHWARANGWCTMAMAELLSVLPENYKGRDEVLHLYRSHIKAIAELQDGTGLWHNMLDRSETFLETSASAMFVYSIAKGINEGWISHVYGPVAITGWNALATKVKPDGEVCGIVVGTTFAHDNTYYFNRGTSCNTPFYGPVMYAGAEIIRLLNNPNLEIVAPKANSMNSAMHFRLKGDKPMR
jgi:unsaturated rhamnogalacturonyl hydrolase